MKTNFQELDKRLLKLKKDNELDQILESLNHNWALDNFHFRFGYKAMIKIELELGEWDIRISKNIINLIKDRAKILPLKDICD